MNPYLILKVEALNAMHLIKILLTFGIKDNVTFPKKEFEVGKESNSFSIGF